MQRQNEPNNTHVQLAPALEVREAHKCRAQARGTCVGFEEFDTFAETEETAEVKEAFEVGDAVELE